MSPVEKQKQWGSTWLQFLDACRRSPQLREQAEKDLLELWEHAQGEFIASLLKRKNEAWTPETQQRALSQLMERFQSLRYAYQQWRMQEPNADLRKSFLPQQPLFTLASLGRPQGNKHSWPGIDNPVFVYSRVLSSLQELVPQKRQSEAAGDIKLDKRKRAIHAAVLKSFSVFQDPPGQLHPDLEKRLEEWKWMPLEELAYELTLWTDKEKREDWSKPEKQEKLVVALKRRIARNKNTRKGEDNDNPWSSAIFIASRYWLPIERTIRKRYARLHWRCVPSSQFLREENIFRLLHGDDIARAHEVVEKAFVRGLLNQRQRVWQHALIDEAFDREKFDLSD